MEEPLNTKVEDTRLGSAESGGVGPMVGTVVVVILIVLGGLYFFIKQFILLK